MKKLSSFCIPSPAELPQAARWLLGECPLKRVFAFYGKMGVGKTSLIKVLCEELGVIDMVNSPTFSIVNEYECAKGGRSIYHFDFYRLQTLSEARDMGCEDYFYSGAYCFIEWPELVEPLLPDDAATLLIEENADGSRTICLLEIDGELA